MDKKKVQRVTVLRTFAVYSNYGSRVQVWISIREGHIIPDFN